MCNRARHPNLGAQPTAEGDRRGCRSPQAQLHWLRAEGCGEVQGFLFGKPMPARQIGRFLANKAGRSADAPVPDAAD